MNKEFVVFILYNFLVPALSLGYRMLDKHTPEMTGGTYHGRYTRDIRDPELLIPRRVHEDSSFLTFNLPNFYDHQELQARRKRNVDDDLADHKVHLVLPFNSIEHHLELTPNHEFISPDLVVETRGENAATDPGNGIRFRRVPDMQCHYRGHVRGHGNSRAALSLCEGVAGYVQTDHGRFFIEPLSETVPEKEGQHVHMVYKRKAPHEEEQKKRNCGTSDDWEAAWAEQIKKKNLKNRMAAGNGTSMKRASNSATHSVHRYIELGLFVDKKFLEYHKGKEYEQYILTLMNMAFDYYHDSSVGNQYDVIIVRIVYLEKQEDEIDLHISPDASKTLASFAAWQHKNNPTDVKHPNHHDIGVLITRYDICDEDKTCGLLGLAYVAAACDPPKAANINEDAGLVLGVVITHEVGHNLGSGHDEPDVSGCKAQDEDGSSFIMSPYSGTWTYRWSTCSRKFFTNYLNSGLGDCLLDNSKQPNDKYKLPGMLPGAMYGSDYQCNIWFPDSTPCAGKESLVCETLWCKLTPDATGCKSMGAAVDGTKCGENKWCIHRECVEMGKRPAAIHGGWGTWGKTSECSRTCGGGIQYTERECDNPQPQNGGRYCLGERRKHSMCNLAPCDEKKPSFIAVQCAEFNDKKVLPDGKSHQWTPRARQEDLNPCTLYCDNEEKNFVKLAPQVKDGTPCKAATNYVCVSGVCRTVGCDWVLDSDAVDDECGICKGDGTQCSPVEGEFTLTGKNDYQKIVTVPKGSRNIKMVEKAAAPNTLAIKYEKSGKYILNGDHVAQLTGEYPCAGDIAIYKHPEPTKEEVYIKGPINEDIQLQYCLYKPTINPGVHWIYYTRNGTTGGKPQYLWDFTEWGPCSAKCGGGSQVAQAVCIEHQSGRVSNSFCEGIKRPEPKSRVCDSEPCGATWRVSQWSRCSACDGKKGQQRRKVQCIKAAARAGGDDVQADLSSCKGKPPKQSQACTGTRPCRKTCAKKTRNSVFGAEDHPSLEEQRDMIDRLVENGISRYSAESNPDHEKKRNVANDSEHSIDDWAVSSIDAGLGDPDNQPGAMRKEFATLKPGSIIEDILPPENIVVMEAPFIPVNVNVSDQAFQEDGEIGGVELEMGKMKNYTGAEAAKMMRSNRTVV